MRDSLRILYPLLPTHLQPYPSKLQPICNLLATLCHENLPQIGTTDMFTESCGLVQHIRAKGSSL